MNGNKPMERLLTLSEVASELGVTYQWVNMLIQKGRLTVEYPEPRKPRIRESILRAYQESRRKGVPTMVEVAA